MSEGDSSGIRRTLQGVAVVTPEGEAPRIVQARPRAHVVDTGVGATANATPVVSAVPEPGAPIPNPANSLRSPVVPPQIPQTPAPLAPLTPRADARAPRVTTPLPSEPASGQLQHAPQQLGASQPGQAPHSQQHRPQQPHQPLQQPQQPQGPQQARPGVRQHARPSTRADGTIGDGPIRVVCRRCQRPVWGWKLPFGVSCPLGKHHAHLSWLLVGVVASFWTVFGVMFLSLVVAIT